jgi:YMGG-like Gly-zipper
MTGQKWSLSLLPLLLLAGCATVPRGPHVAVMPGRGVSFAQFEADDRACRGFAERSVGIGVDESGANNVVTGAVVGTALGAAAGALIGGHHSAATGAGIGLVTGSAMGAGNAAAVQGDTQRRYDIAYEQCMYAKGNQLPRARRTTRVYRERVYPDVVYERVPERVIIHERDSVPPDYPAPDDDAYPPPPPPDGYDR